MPVQAEDSTLCCRATVAKSGTGFVGGGFVTGLTSFGAGAAFDVVASASGPGTVTARYSAAFAPQTPEPTHTLTLYVNGSKVRRVTFAPLANLDTWDFETETVSLKAGANTVSYVVDTGDTGNVELDLVLGDPDSGAEGGGDAGARTTACPGGGGCGCRLGPPPDSRAPAVLGILGVALGVRRRRR
jgi:MYXO-CTERM domain-containing protein